MQDGEHQRSATLLGILRDALRKTSRRERRGLAVMALGFVLILAGVLHLTIATVGGPVRRFEDRRTYNQVKVAAHEAYPLTLALGLAGIGVVILGNRLRTAGRGAESRDDS
jgi:hypothetical protein